MNTLQEENGCDVEAWTVEPNDRQPLQVSQATESALELPSLLALIASGAATDLGAARISELRPTADLDLLKVRRLRFDEARRLMVGQSIVSSRERPIQPIINSMARVSHHLEGLDLVGEARMQVLFWNIYDARLYAPDGNFDADANFALRKQRRREYRQSRILGAGNRDFAIERNTARDCQLFH